MCTCLQQYIQTWGSSVLTLVARVLEGAQLFTCLICIKEMLKAVCSHYPVTNSYSNLNMRSSNCTPKTSHSKLHSSHLMWMMPISIYPLMSPQRPPLQLLERPMWHILRWPWLQLLYSFLPLLTSQQQSNPVTPDKISTMGRHGVKVINHSLFKAVNVSIIDLLLKRISMQKLS